MTPQPAPTQSWFTTTATTAPAAPTQPMFPTAAPVAPAPSWFPAAPVAPTQSWFPTAAPAPTPSLFSFSVAACAPAHGGFGGGFGAPSTFGVSAAFGRSAPKPKLGVANAARVSKGSVVDSWGGLTVHAPERHQSEHVTVTVVIYNTVVGGVPTVADVAAAIDDLERLYAGCSAAGKLAEPTFDFMKHGMAGSGASQQVAQKVALQPYTHTAGVVQNPAVFPTDSTPPNYFLHTPLPQQQQPAPTQPAPTQPAPTQSWFPTHAVSAPTVGAFAQGS